MGFRSWTDSRCKSIVLALLILQHVAPNKQLQRTVIPHRGDAASAPFHYALASRFTRQRSAAELRR
jgi:hypothetical protein